MKINLAVIMMSSLFLLTACGGDGFSTKEGREISGDVSFNWNHFSPLASAHAKDEAICKPASGVNNRKVKIYLVDKSGVEVKICETNLDANKKYKFTLVERLVPEGSILKVKAELTSTITREAVSEIGGVSSLSVDASSTIASSVVEDFLINNNGASSAVINKKIKEFVFSSLGVQPAGLSADKIAVLKLMFKSSKEAVSSMIMVEKNGADAANNNPALKSFLINVYADNFKVKTEESIRSGNHRLVYK